MDRVRELVAFQMHQIELKEQQKSREHLLGSNSELADIESNRQYPRRSWSYGRDDQYFHSPPMSSINGYVPNDPANIGRSASLGPYDQPNIDRSASLGPYDQPYYSVEPYPRASSTEVLYSGKSQQYPELHIDTSERRIDRRGSLDDPDSSPATNPEASQGYSDPDNSGKSGLLSVSEDINADKNTDGERSDSMLSNLQSPKEIAMAERRFSYGEMSNHSSNLDREIDPKEKVKGQFDPERPSSAQAFVSYDREPSHLGSNLGRSASFGESFTKERTSNSAPFVHEHEHVSSNLGRSASFGEHAYSNRGQFRYRPDVDSWVSEGQHGYYRDRRLDYDPLLHRNSRIGPGDFKRPYYPLRYTQVITDRHLGRSSSFSTQQYERPYHTRQYNTNSSGGMEQPNSSRSYVGRSSSFTGLYDGGFGTPYDRRAAPWHHRSQGELYSPPPHDPRVHGSHPGLYSPPPPEGPLSPAPSVESFASMPAYLERRRYVSIHRLSS